MNAQELRKLEVFEGTEDSILKLVHRIENCWHRYIDNHNNTEQILQGYAILKKGEVCPIYPDSRYFCLNSLYVSEHDYLVHLSQCSCGGTVIMDRDIEEAVMKYNDSLMFDGSKIVKYVVF